MLINFSLLKCKHIKKRRSKNLSVKTNNGQDLSSGKDICHVSPVIPNCNCRSYLNRTFKPYCT